MGSVLLATDGSDPARRAAERAIDLAQEREATLHVVCVVDRRRFGETGLSSDEVTTIQAEDSARDCVAAVARMAEDADLDVVEVVRHGVPQEEILAYADEIDADVVVVGEHGTHEHHFGGVGRAVADQTDREVQVVGADA